MKEPIIIGIYQIRNLINNFVYIGSTNNFKRRKREHLRSMIAKKCSIKFQNAINKYGIENFVFEIVFEIKTLEMETSKINEILIKKEQEFININIDNSYNTRFEAQTNRGIIYSAERNKKISIARKGKPLSKENIEKLRMSHIGKHLGDEHKAKLSKGFLGEKNPNYGKIMSEEQKLKISQSLSGEKNPNYGKKFSEEFRLKLSKANTKYQLKKTHCPQGHEYTEENTYIQPSGSRNCRICLTNNRIRFNERKKNMENKEGFIKLGAPAEITPHGNSYDATDLNTTIEEPDEKEKLEEKEQLKESGDK